jgi:hypothetical protein
LDFRGGVIRVSLEVLDISGGGVDLFAQVSDGGVTLADRFCVLCNSCCVRIRKSADMFSVLLVVESE